MITSVVTSPPLSYGPTRADAMVASSARQGTEGGGERTDAFKFHVTVFQVPRQQIEKKIDIFFSKKKCAGTKYFFFRIDRFRQKFIDVANLVHSLHTRIADAGGRKKKIVVSTGLIGHILIAQSIFPA